MTSAIGLPRRVTRNGLFVLSTSSNNDKHFALNSEIAISWTERFLFVIAMVDFRFICYLTNLIYYGHQRWSTSMGSGVCAQICSCCSPRRSML